MGTPSATGRRFRQRVNQVLLGCSLMVSSAAVVSSAAAYADDEQSSVSDVELDLSAAAGSPQQAAIVLGHRARERFLAGDYLRALDLFRAAEDLAHSPQFVLHMARSLVQLGRWVDANEMYERVLEERLTEASAAPFHAAVQAAQSEAPLLKARIPRLILRTSGASGRVRAELDSNPIALNRVLLVDPGPHTLHVFGEQGVVSEHVHFVAGETREVNVPYGERAVHHPALPGGAVPEGAVPEGALPGRDSPPHADALDASPQRERTGLNTASWALFLAGGAAVVSGVVTGIYAYSEGQAIRARCPEQGCPESLDARRREAEAWATVADVSWLAAGVCGIAGLSLLLVDDGDAPHATKVGVSPSGVWLSADF